MEQRSPSAPRSRRWLLRRASGLLGALASGVSLAACGGGTQVRATGTSSAPPTPSTTSRSAPAITAANASGKATSASPTAPASAAVTLHLTSWLSQPTSIDVYQKQIIQPYQQATPGTTVVLETVNQLSAYNDKLTAYAASNQLPDVMEVSYAYFPEWVKAGWLDNLDPYIQADKINLEDYDKTVMGVGRWPYQTGHTYSWWTMMGVGTFYYNKTMFDGAGQSYPDATWTWGKAREVAQVLTKPGKQWGLQLASYYEGLIYADGGAILNADSTKCLLDQPGSVNAHQYWADLYLKYKVTPTSDDLKAAGLKGSDDPFAAGHVGMYLHGSYQIGPFRQTIKDLSWDIAPPPKGSAGPAALIAGNPSHGLAATGKHQEQAWAFLRWWVTRQTPEQVVLPGNLPTRLAAAQQWTSEQAKIGTPASVDLIVNVAEQDGKPSPIGPHWSEWQAVWTKARSAIFAGKQTAADALRDATTQIDVILAKP